MDLGIRWRGVEGYAIYMCQRFSVRHVLIDHLFSLFPYTAVRSGHTSFVLSDGSVVVIGGGIGATYYNDVWKSSNGGSLWFVVTANAPWKGINMSFVYHAYEMHITTHRILILSSSS
jgi:hypothetical protein